MAKNKKQSQQSNNPMYFAQFGYLLNRTGSLGAAYISNVLKEFDMPLPIWQILLILSNFKELTISELASHTGIEMSHLYRTVLKAEKCEFVVRTKSTTDKRVSYIKLAPQGYEIISKILPKTRNLSSIAFEGIAEGDIEIAANILNMVYDNLVSNIDPASADTSRKLIIAQRTKKNVGK